MNTIKIVLMSCLLCLPWASLSAQESGQGKLDSQNLEQLQDNLWQDVDFWEGAVGGLLFHELGHVWQYCVSR